MSSIVEMFSYSFIVRALVVGVLLSLCASLVGVSLVLKKNSMIGDGLSHVGFGAMAIALVLGWTPIWFSMVVVVIVSFFILKINENSKIHGDSLIALISSSALAIGTFAISIFKGVNIDINNYLFGSILAIGKLDVILSIILSIIVILIYVLFYNKIFAITMDENFAKSIGIKVNFYNMVFAALCSIVVVLGMRLMGALLISSLIIFPTLSAMQCFKSFKSVVLSSVVISIFSFILGLIISYLFSTPTGASIVIVNLIIFIIFKIISYIRRT